MRGEGLITGRVLLVVWVPKGGFPNYSVLDNKERPASVSSEAEQRSRLAGDDEKVRWTGNRRGGRNCAFSKGVVVGVFQLWPNGIIDRQFGRQVSSVRPWVRRCACVEKLEWPK